jgi:hypothetical protein
MSVGTLARYTPISGPRIPVKVLASGVDKFGPLTLVQVTSRPTGSAYRKGEILVVSLGSPALTVR